MQEDARKLGENLKRIRSEKNITQGKIAEALGADRSFISNIEKGKTNPTLATIAKLAKALSIPIEELIK